MSYKSRFCTGVATGATTAPAITLLETVIAMAIITIVFAAVLPQFRAIHNSWDSKQANAEVLQNGRVLIDHMNRNLSKAVKITAVSDSAEIDGYIQFEDNDGNTLRYDIADNNYVEFGTVGGLSDLAGPVSSLQFTCYDSNDFGSTTTDVNTIRLIEVQTTLPNPATLSQSKTFTTSAYLRTNWDSSSSGLVGWWKLDETSGTTAADSSGSGNDGTLVNMDPSTDWVSGQIGGALDFDGTNDYIEVADSTSLDMGNTFTVSLWVKWESGAAPLYNKILDKKSAYNASTGWEIGTGSNDTDVQVIGSGGTTQDITAVDSWVASEWHHFAVVFGEPSATQCTVYAEGSALATVTIDEVVNSADPLLIGYYGGGSGYAWNGKIDDVRIYDRALDANEVAQLANTISYDTFNETKVSTADTSVTISTPGDSSTVATLGSWTSGLTHTAEAGSNRALIFIAHEESISGSPTLTSVTYGGEAMTKVVERSAIAGLYGNYVAAFILNEAGINAATSSTFVPTWSAATSSFSYASVFLSGVDQTTSIGATDSAGTTSSTPNPITTSALSTANGDMVILGAVCGNNGSYILNNGFTEGTDQSVGSFGHTGVTGHKAATGANETPSAKHTAPNRQAIIGLVVQGGGLSSIEGDLLIAAVATDGSETISPPGGEGWTEIDVDNYNGEVTLGAWWKLADASESATHQFTWTGDEQAYGWMMHFTGHHLTDPIDVWSSSGESSSTPTSPAVTTTVDNCMIVRLGAFDDDDITIDDPGLSSHTAITMDESDSATSGTTSILGSWTTDLTHTAEAGSSRALIFIAHEESTFGSPTLTSVTYGGEAMTKVIERSAIAWPYGNYVVAFILDEAGINAAASSTFVPTWSAATSSFSYASVFLSGVDQSDPYGATASNSTTSVFVNTITTSALSTAAGDMVILGATCGNNGSYILNNGFTEGTDQSVGSFGHTGVTGHKAATGANETPSAKHTAPNRQVIIGLVVQSGAGVSGTVSGGAGYVKQSASGDSGTSDFLLGSSNEAQMLTIAIAPDSGSAGTGEGIRP